MSARCGATAIWVAFAMTACDPPSGDEAEQQQTVDVRCEPVRVGPIEERIELRGVVGVPPGREAVMAPAVAGRLVEVRVSEGDRVQRNDVLAVVDDPALTAAVNEGDAAVGAAQAALKNAGEALARAERLVEKGIAPRRDVEEARARHAQAEADLRAASARRLLAAQQRQRAKLVSPIDGEVTRLIGKVGDLVDGTPATPVVVIDDQQVLELHLDVPAADLVRIHEKAPTEIRLNALPDVVFRGEVSALSPSVDPATELGTARIAFDPASPELSRVRIGLSGAATIVAAERPDVTLVPAAALRRSSEGTNQVVVCSTSSTAVVREVTPGIRGVEVIEITDGLRPGDQVVVDHVVGLEDGTPIRDVSARSSGSAQ